VRELNFDLTSSHAGPHALISGRFRYHISDNCHQDSRLRAKTMENTMKPGADLLWAFQLHREHRALSKRLTAVEATAAKHQDKVTASEQQVAGLAGELRGTRQQLEQVRDKVKLVEKASKDAVGKSEDRDEELQGQLGELSSSVVQLQRRVGHSESRLQRLTDNGVHAAADGLQVSSERHEDQIKRLSEELRGLERAQGQLRGLIENAVRDHRVAPAMVAPTRSKTAKNASRDTALSTSRRAVGGNGQPRDGPHPILDGPEIEQEILDSPASQLPNKTMSPDAETSALPVARAAQKKPSGTTKRKRFEKEISQLMYGDGSLTNAPIILESQDLGANTRGSKKLKVDMFEGRSLRSAFTKPESQSKLTKIKEKPARVQAKAPALPRKALVTASKTATKTADTQRAPKTAAPKTRGRKAAPEPTKTLSTKQPPPPSYSSEIQVAYSQASSASEEEPVATSPSLPMKKENGHSKRQKQLPQQQPKKARRYIVQDDSMEEFLAKCEAAIGT
jgi:hypothetical protein